MGVRGLYSYIQEHAQEALEWHKLTGRNLVIDGNNLAHSLYSECTGINAAFGGDYDKYANFVTKYFEALKKCDVKAIVIMDGGQPLNGRKITTVRQRMTVAVRTCLNINPSNQFSYKIFPPMARQVFVTTLTKMGVQVLQTDFEADVEVAVVAKHLGHTVLSNDSDFVIFNVPLVRLESVNHKEIYSQKDPITGKVTYYMPCYFFNIDLFCEITGLAPKHLPLLATLLGNDYIDAIHFKKFYSYLTTRNKKDPTGKRKKNHSLSNRHEKIRNVIRWLVDHKRHSSEMLVKKMAFLFGRHMRFVIQDSIDLYSADRTSNLLSLIPEANPPVLKTFKKPTNVIDKKKKKKKPVKEAVKIETDLVLKNGRVPPAWFMKAYREHRVPHEVTDILTQGYFISPPQVELEIRPSSYLAAEQVVRSVYTFLWKGIDTDANIPEPNLEPVVVGTNKLKFVVSKGSKHDKNYESLMDADVVIDESDADSNDAMKTIDPPGKAVFVKVLEPNDDSDADVLIESDSDEEMSEGDSPKENAEDISQEDNIVEDVQEISIEEDAQDVSIEEEALEDNKEDSIEEEAQDVSIAEEALEDNKEDSIEEEAQDVSIAEEAQEDNKEDSIEEEAQEDSIENNAEDSIENSIKDNNIEDNIGDINKEESTGAPEASSSNAVAENGQAKLDTVVKEGDCADVEMEVLDVKQEDNTSTEHQTEERKNPKEDDEIKEDNKEDLTVEMKKEEDSELKMDEENTIAVEEVPDTGEIKGEVDSEINGDDVCEGEPGETKGKGTKKRYKGKPKREYKPKPRPKGEHKPLPNKKLKWFIRKRGELWVKELNFLKHEQACLLPTLEDVEFMSLEEKKEAFYKMLNLKSKFHKLNLPTDLELILDFIVYWLENTQLHLRDCHIMSVLLCIFMYHIIDSKTDRVRTKKELKKAEGCQVKLTKMMKEEKYANPDATITELMEQVTPEECMVAANNLFPLHHLKENLTQHNFSKETVHAFSEFQACVYFLQLVNSLLCFPFPLLSIEFLWGGTFCYNIFQDLKKLDERIMWIREALGIGTCLERLFVLLYNQINSAHKILIMRNPNSLKPYHKNFKKEQARKERELPKPQKKDELEGLLVAETKPKAKKKQKISEIELLDNRFAGFVVDDTDSDEESDGVCESL